MIHLPSERTLSNYPKWATPHNGVQLELILSNNFNPCFRKKYLVDSITVPSPWMKWNSSQDLSSTRKLVHTFGFADLGSCNHDMEQAVGDQDESSTGQLAEQVFVFQARAVFKTSLFIHYFSASLKVTKLLCRDPPPPPQKDLICYLVALISIGEKIFSLAWEVTESTLEMYDIPVVSLTSDGAKPSRCFYSVCQQQQKGKSTRLSSHSERGRTCSFSVMLPTC